MAITSVFGNPLSPRTWSGAPYNLSIALERLGVSVEGVYPRLSRASRLVFSGLNLASGLGVPRSGEQILRAASARRWCASQVADMVARLGARHVLHTGTLDLPARDTPPGVKHYLYCDHTWALSARNRPDIGSYNMRALQIYDRLEHDALAGIEHVFTFSSYVRESLIDDYGLSPRKVTAVGSGRGNIEPYFGPKDYSKGTLLFVAKHLFRAKGGNLVVEAFRIARDRRPDLSLIVVGDERSRQFIPRDLGVDFRAYLPWHELQQLYRDATLLVQPMLNDPWGQVYLEALASRTPVLGLNRNGLPEIIENGRYGFLAEQPEPRTIAELILQALEDPARLSRMGVAGQHHVLASYSWDNVAQKIAFS